MGLVGQDGRHHEACEHEREETVKVLLKHGGRAYWKGENGYTPLSLAARAGDVVCVRLLLETS